MNKTVIGLFYLSILALVLSCKKLETVTMSKDLSICAFILADNDLDDHARYIENDLVSGLRACPVGTELFLYVDRMNWEPTLRHMFVIESGQVAVKTLSEYTGQCSTSPQVFVQVLSSMLNAASGQRYGLIFWSHGNGWLPGLNYYSSVTTRAIGADGIYSMDIEDFENTLSDTKKPSYVVFDACYMGAVEVAYSLRNSSDYIIASSSETLGVFFPYHLMLPELVKGNQESLAHSLDIYLDYCYTDYYGDGTISGMASLIDCSQVEMLASVYKNLLEHSKDSIVKDGIQVFDCSYPHLYYDLDDYVHAITDDSLSLALFDDQLSKTVVHKVTTPSVFTQTGGRDSMLTINHYSGLSTYIPGTSPMYDYAYKQTEWYRDCYGE